MVKKIEITNILVNILSGSGLKPSIKNKVYQIR